MTYNKEKNQSIEAVLEMTERADLNINTKTIKLIGKMHRKTFVFWDRQIFFRQGTKKLKHKNYNLDFIKILNFCSLKDTTKKIQRQALQWENIAHGQGTYIQDIY